MRWEKAWDNRSHIQDWITTRQADDNLAKFGYRGPYYDSPKLGIVLYFKAGEENAHHFSRPGGGPREGGGGKGASWAHDEVPLILARRRKLAVMLCQDDETQSRFPFLLIFDGARVLSQADRFKPDIQVFVVDCLPLNSNLVGNTLNLEINMSHAVEPFKRIFLHLSDHVTLEVDWPPEFAKQKFTKGGSADGMPNGERLAISFSEDRLARFVVPSIPAAARLLELKYDEVTKDSGKPPFTRIIAAVLGVADECRGATVKPANAILEAMKAYKDFEAQQILSRLEPPLLRFLRRRQQIVRGLTPLDDARIAEDIEYVAATCVKVNSLIAEGVIRRVGQASWSGN